MAAFSSTSPISNRLLLLHGSFNGVLRDARSLHQWPRPARSLEASKEGLHLRWTGISHGFSPPIAVRHTSKKQFLSISASVSVPPPAPAHRPSGQGSLTSLAVAIAVPFVSGMLASIFNSANVEWYNSLRKPAWNPPSWLFGAAWGVLYVVMGFASWLVWMQGGWDVQGHALSLYVLQLVLNLAWPALFFGAKRIRLALIDILALWLLILACIRAFQPIHLLAARLLYPYLAWVTFATALNYKYLELN